MKTPKDYVEIINRAIEEIQYPDWLPGLYDPIRYAMAAGGKRVRPTLLLACCDAFQGQLADAVQPALGIEIFHNFTLVHDDVMDHADMRRGRPTVYRKWDINTAILAGDTMMIMAYKCMSDCDPQLLPEVMARFNRMTLDVSEGQQIDADFETAQKVSFQEYLRMIMGKTSALIAYPCAIGALLAGAQPEDIDLIFNFGTSLGIAFQMQDDYLDVYGDPATFGKAIGGDILNDKKTWLWIMASDSPKGAELQEIVAQKLPDAEKIARVTALYDSLGLREAGAKLVSQYTDDAIGYLRETSMPAEGKEWLEAYAHKLIGRTK